MAKGVVSFSDDFVKKSIFHVFSDYHRVAYSHNLLAEEILNVFFEDIDDLIPRYEWYLQKERLLDVFSTDADAAMSLLTGRLSTRMDMVTRSFWINFLIY